MALFFVLLTAVVGVLAFGAGFSAASSRPGGPAINDVRLAADLRRREALTEHLREIAWRDRDVAPELSTVILDEIRIFAADPEAWERRQLGG